MFVGLNVNHDSSISLHDESGEVQFAIAEERLNRIKNFWGIPREGLAHVSKYVDTKDIQKVWCGSHSVFPKSSTNLLAYILNSRPSNYFDFANEPIPVGWLQNNSSRFIESCHESGNSIKGTFESFLRSELETFGITAPLEFVNHHESHAFSAIVGSGFEDSLVITLDGEGDFEAGSVGIWSRSKYTPLARIDRKNSVGNFYSEVTKRYGFKRAKHEGKITGLAARVSPNQNLKVLNAYLRHSAGDFLKDRQLNNSFPSILEMVSNHDNRNFEEALIDILALSESDNAQLASNAQAHLEITVLDFIRYWRAKTESSNLCIAGGVFANVRLNQRITEELGFSQVYIYPNMGDGGLSVGAVWKGLNSAGKELKGHQNLFLGFEYKDVSSSFASQTSYLADELSKGAILGLFRGRSEWGPRALCNRSIIASPTVAGISKKLNHRLNRNDFMPFAPIVSQRFSQDVFKLSKFSHPSNYQNMTITTDVSDNWTNKLAEVMNVDGTARPQIVPEHDVELTNLLDNHQAKTGCPVLINTSFNAHEEPIVETDQQAIHQLLSQRIDLLSLNGALYTLDNGGIVRISQT